MDCASDMMAGSADETPAGYAYWRLLANAAVTDTISFCAAEIEMIVSGSTDECTGGSAISGGDSAVKANAFDDDTGNYWASSQSGAAVNGAAYIGYQFAAPKGITKVRFRTAPFGSASTPASLLIQRSSDGVSWTTANTWAIGAVSSNTWYETTF